MLEGYSSKAFARGHNHVVKNGTMFLTTRSFALVSRSGDDSRVAKAQPSASTAQLESGVDEDLDGSSLDLPKGHEYFLNFRSFSMCG